MNIIYLTMSSVTDVSVGGVHTDFLRKFRDEGYNVFVVSPRERRTGIRTCLAEDHGIHNLGVRTLNLQKTNAIEKGLGQVFVTSLFKRAIKKYLKEVNFDLIVYATPPVTFVGVVKYLKRLNPAAVTYLTLKDIFPQNAVDLGLLSKTGVKGVFYRHFRRQEKALYSISDWIGCMSPANVRYLLGNNPELPEHKVEICPNSFGLPPETAMNKDKLLLQRYGLPVDRPIFFYGGNLGKPQGIPFLLECMKANAGRLDCHFIIVGSGVAYPEVEKWVSGTRPRSVSLFKFLPQEDYNKLIRSCDVGMIFLDYRFTIPNYPSRLLNCLLLKKPVIACTDPHCDTGAIAEKNGYGYYCPSNSVEAFTLAVEKMLHSDIPGMGQRGYEFFVQNYTTKNTCDTIMKHIVSLQE